MEMNYSQGFIDGYEGRDHDYNNSTNEYHDEFHKGRDRREVHLKVFEIHFNECGIDDLVIKHFQNNNELARYFMNSW